MAGFNSKYTREGFDEKLSIDTDVQIGGLNLIKGIDRFDLIGISDMVNIGGVYSYPLSNIDYSGIRNQNVVVSVEVKVRNLTQLRQDNLRLPTRVGFELIVQFTDDTIQPLSCWSPTLAIGDYFEGRIYEAYTIRDQPIKEILQQAIYIQAGNGTVLQVGRPKLEIAKNVSSFTPDPNYLIEQFDLYKNELGNDADASLDELEEATGTVVGGEIILNLGSLTISSGLADYHAQLIDLEPNTQYTLIIGHSTLLEGSVVVPTYMSRIKDKVIADIYYNNYTFLVGSFSEQTTFTTPNTSNIELVIRPAYLTSSTAGVSLLLSNILLIKNV